MFGSQILEVTIGVIFIFIIAARGPDTDCVSSHPKAPSVSLKSIGLNMENVRNNAVQRVFLTAVDAAQGDLAKAQANIEAWYNSAMAVFRDAISVSRNGLFSGSGFLDPLL